VNHDPVNWIDLWGLECSASDKLVQKLINMIEVTEWAETDEGAKIVEILNELNVAGRITILDTPRVSPGGSLLGGGYDIRDDTITITRDNSRFGMETMAATLGHEGMHALQAREGDVIYNPETQTLSKYDFTDERRAYDEDSTLKSEFFGIDYPRVTDEYFHYWYDHRFTE
jgi:hypothetical protein